MTRAALLTMMGILTFVWGGFVAAVLLALSRERHKRGPRRDR
ncbi:MAG: hypothetical protein ACE5HU_07265 [Acidobacteriota bacterium]